MNNKVKISIEEAGSSLMVIRISRFCEVSISAL